MANTTINVKTNNSHGGDNKINNISNNTNTNTNDNTEAYTHTNNNDTDNNSTTYGTGRDSNTTDTGSGNGSGHQNERKALSYNATEKSLGLAFQSVFGLNGNGCPAPPGKKLGICIPECFRLKW